MLPHTYVGARHSRRGPRPEPACAPGTVHAVVVAHIEKMCPSAAAEWSPTGSLVVTVPTAQWRIPESGEVLRATVSETELTRWNPDDPAWLMHLASDLSTAHAMVYIHGAGIDIAAGALVVPDAGPDWLRTHCTALDELYGSAAAAPAAPRSASAAPEQSVPDPTEPPADAVAAAADAVLAALPETGTPRKRDAVRTASGQWHLFDAAVSHLRDAGLVTVTSSPSGAMYARAHTTAPDAEAPGAGEG